MSRMGPDGTFGPGKVVKELSTEFEDIMPNVRARDDGSFEIVFSSTVRRGAGASRRTRTSTSPIPGGSPASGPRRATSATAVNTSGVEQRSTLSADGKRLYFGRDGDIFVSQRLGHH